MRRMLIVGAGGHGRSVAEIVLMTNQFHLAGFADDLPPPSGQVWDVPVFGPASSLEEYRKYADFAIVAIGNNQVRESLHMRLLSAGFEPTTIIHPLAIASSRASIGVGCAIMGGAVVGVEARLGTGVIVNCGAVVDHHCTVEEFGHLGVNAAMAGGSYLGRGAWMQASSAIGYSVHIEAGRVLLPGVAVAIGSDHESNSKSKSR